MKVLFIGDASNYHNALTTELRRRGVEVTVVSDGNRWMDTRRDIDITRRLGRMGGAMLYARLRYLLSTKLRGYDVVHLCGTNFVTLQPSRLQSIVRALKKKNGKVYLSMVNNDAFYVDMCSNPDHMLRYNEWRVGESPSPRAVTDIATYLNWKSEKMMDHCRYIYDSVDGVATALYEYHLSVERMNIGKPTAYIGVPIDTGSLSVVPFDISGKIRICLACHPGRSIEKGAVLLDTVLTQLAAEYPDEIDYARIGGLPYEEFLEQIKRVHIVADQLYSYSPATTALLAMAMGRTTISGGEPEFYEFIKEKDLFPIINCDPTNLQGLYKDLKMAITHKGILKKLAEEGPRFVEKHNSAKIVIDRLMDLWKM